MNERLLKIVDYLIYNHLVKSRKDFGESVGKSSSQISDMLKGIKPISVKTIHLICQVFPIVNEDWFLTGEGDMLKSDNTSSGTITIDKKVLDTIMSQQETIQSQQRLLEKLVDAKFQTPALPEDPAGCAGAAGA
ncbi:MAG: helix-turn-helix domain-containing protein [Bacteroidales bacterium]|nr:helix-turn-helix domain-containing protein [Bacteroidales bacterium]